MKRKALLLLFFPFVGNKLKHRVHKSYEDWSWDRPQICWHYSLCSSPLLLIIKLTCNAEILYDCCCGGGPRLLLIEKQACLSWVLETRSSYTSSTVDSSLDGRRWTGQLKTCFFSLDPLSDFTPTPVPTPGTPRKRPKLRNCLYKRCFETWGQCSSALFFISSPAGFQNFQKCNANNELLGSLSCSPQLETNFCFCGFSFAFLLHGTCEHCFVS